MLRVLPETPQACLHAPFPWLFRPVKVLKFSIRTGEKSFYVVRAAFDKERDLNVFRKKEI